MSRGYCCWLLAESGVINAVHIICLPLQSEQASSPTLELEEASFSRDLQLGIHRAVVASYRDKCVLFVSLSLTCAGVCVHHRCALMGTGCWFVHQVLLVGKRVDDAATGAGCAVRVCCHFPRRSLHRGCHRVSVCPGDALVAHSISTHERSGVSGEALLTVDCSPWLSQFLYNRAERGFVSLRDRSCCVVLGFRPGRFEPGRLVPRTACLLVRAGCSSAW